MKKAIFLILSGGVFLGLAVWNFVTPYECTIFGDFANAFYILLGSVGLFSIVIGCVDIVIKKIKC